MAAYQTAPAPEPLLATTADGLRLELLSARPAAGMPPRPPLLFVHGAYAGAWIWSEHFLPFFAAHGHPAYAVSLRGHGGSDGGDCLDAHGLADYCADLHVALRAVAAPAVVIGHSLGGLLAQMLLGAIPLRGLVLLAPVPPEGMFSLSWRLALRDPWLWNETALAAWDARSSSAWGMRRALLPDDLPEAAARRYCARMQGESGRALIEAQFPTAWCSAAGLGVPSLVLAGGRDRLIPADSVARTAVFHGASLHQIDGAHGLMLEPSWRPAAELVLRWLAANV